MSSGLPPLSRTRIEEVERLLQSGLSFAKALEGAASKAAHHLRYPLPGEIQPTPPTTTSHIAEGRFIDVFRHWGFTSASLWEKSLYLAWWAHRPSVCKECGSRDRWHPSAEEEYSCGHCSKGSGSTHVNDIVMDVEYGAENDEHDADSDDDDDAQQKGGEVGNEVLGIGSTHASSGTQLISLFAHYVKVLEGLPTAVRPSTDTYHVICKLALDLAELVPLLSLAEGLSTSDGKIADGVYQNDETPVALIRTAALYVACAVVCPGMVPFPLFLRAAGIALQRARGSESVAGAFACQWMDVVSLAHSVGIVLDDFFSSTKAIEGHMTNVMVILERFAPSSVAWSPSRKPERLRVIQNELAPLREQNTVALENGLKHGTCGVQTDGSNTLGVGQRFSPEHTAVFVALELVRLYQLSDPACPRMESWYQKHTSSFPRLALIHAASGLSSVQEVRDESQLLPGSSWANLLLHMFAKELFSVSPLELSELLLASNLYRGATQFFEILSERTSMGFFDLPLQRRLRPLVSPWSALFSSLHSEDRLIVTSLLQLAEHQGQGGNTTQEKAACRLLQKILRKHGSLGRFQFNYGLSVKNVENNKHFNGLFFCSHTSSDCTVFTCLRTGRKTVAYDANTGQVVLSYYGTKARAVDSVDAEFIGPVVVQTEDSAAKLILDLVQNNMHQREWMDALFRLTAREVVKRRLQASAGDPRAVLYNLRRIINEAADTPHTPLTSTCGMIRDKESRLAFILNTWAKRKSAKELGILRRSEETGENEFRQLSGTMDGVKGEDVIRSPSMTPSPKLASLPDSTQSKTSSLLQALERQQLETVLESFEENCLALPAPSFVAGLPVSTLIERFAELHVLCEGRYVPRVHPKRGNHKASKKVEITEEDPVSTALDEKIAAIVGPPSARASTAMSSFRLASRSSVESLLKSAVHRYHQYLYQQYVHKQTDLLRNEGECNDSPNNVLKSMSLYPQSAEGSWKRSSEGNISASNHEHCKHRDESRNSDGSETARWSDTIVALVESASATSSVWDKKATSQTGASVGTKRSREEADAPSSRTPNVEVSEGFSQVELVQIVNSTPILGRDRRAMQKRRQQNLKSQRFPMDEALRRQLVPSKGGETN